MKAKEQLISISNLIPPEKAKNMFLDIKSSVDRKVYYQTEKVFIKEKKYNIEIQDKYTIVLENNNIVIEV